MNKYDVIIVGGGVAGLTAAAYLSEVVPNVLLLEKEKNCGGLLGAFEFAGHTVDKGARAIIDSGIFSPMKKQLDLDIEFSENPIRMSVENETMVLNDIENLTDYAHMLKKLFPDNNKDIDLIMLEIKKVMKYMDVIYGIENPLFVSQPYPIKYLTKTLLPWMSKFLYNINKANKMFEPTDSYLAKFTNNQELISIITQHFFAETPTFFALSYFSLYLDYSYPIGSTQRVVDELKKHIIKNGGTIKNEVEVVAIDVFKNLLNTKDGSQFVYDHLLWAADLKHFYNNIIETSITDSKVKKQVIEKRDFLSDKVGADSIISVYVIVSLPPITFKDIIGPHEFYTPNKFGLTYTSIDEIKSGNEKFIEDETLLMNWIKKFIKNNTIEISIPALRDASLSLKGESAIIASTLFDYKLMQHLEKLGLIDKVKSVVENSIIEILAYRISHIRAHVLNTLVSTPLTIERLTYASHGSITGWSFANKPFPVETRFLKVSKSILTPIDNILVAGQWTFNPAGVPVSILTAKLAVDAILKKYNKDSK